MAMGEFDVVTYALLKGQGGGGGGSDIETNVTNTPAGQLLSNIVIDGVRYDLNNLTKDSMVSDTVYVDIENNKSILEAECIATFEERYGEDHTKWPTYPVYAILACETSDGYKWEEQGMLSISFDNADNTTIEFYQIADGTSYTFLTDMETGETFYDGLIVPSTPKIEINDYETTPQEIIGRIKINGENYEFAGSVPSELSLDINDATDVEDPTEEDDSDSYPYWKLENPVIPGMIRTIHYNGHDYHLIPAKPVDYSGSHKAMNVDYYIDEGKILDAYYGDFRGFFIYNNIVGYFHTQIYIGTDAETGDQFVELLFFRTHSYLAKYWNAYEEDPSVLTNGHDPYPFAEKMVGGSSGFTFERGLAILTSQLDAQFLSNYFNPPE